MATALTPIQDQIIARLAAGETVTAAANALNLHRTTIHAWKRANPDFANALADAKEDAADQHRAACHQHTDVALTAIVAVLHDPKTSPSVRLKAALYILQGATGQPPSKATTAAAQKRQNSSPVNTVAPAAAAPLPHSSLFITSADTTGQPYVRTTPKVGRNEKCPCGSGKKYKICCLDNRHAA